jgi:hypothetical protein
MKTIMKVVLTLKSALNATGLFALKEKLSIAVSPR